MKSIFLGIGNSHRADDAIGPVLAAQLEENAALKELGVDVMEHSGEGASLMHIWEGADKVIAVDAMKTGGELGSIHRFDAIKDVLNYGVFRYSSHLFGLAEATELSRSLETLPKELIIYGVEGIEFTFGSEMSSEVKAAIDEVKAAVLKDFLG